MKSTLTLFMILFSLSASLAQDTLHPIRVQTIVFHGDTLPFIDIDTTAVLSPPKVMTHKEKMRYDRLVYNVKIAYPYAKIAAEKLREYRDAMNLLDSDKKRKEYIKKAEKDLEASFGKQVRELTFSQGKILIKLIYRETGNSSFEIVKDLKGSFSAFIWQTLAGLFGYNLKSQYDPEGDDKTIEMIVRAIDAGEI